MSRIFKNSEFLWGQAGLPGDGITTGEKGTINSRLDALESAGTDLALNDLTNVDAPSPSNGQLLRFNDGEWSPYTLPAKTVKTGLTFLIDGGGDVITTGEKGDIFCPFSGTITGWTLLANETGSIALQLAGNYYAGWPTVNPATSNNPAISGARKAQGPAPNVIAMVEGYIIRVSVLSVTNIKRVTLNLSIDRQV